MPQDHTLKQPDWIKGSFETRAELEDRLSGLYARLQRLDLDDSIIDRANLNVNIAEVLLALGNPEAAWQTARPCIADFIEKSDWEGAVAAFDLLYRCDQPKSVMALGMGCWLAITYPINPALTVEMMNHIIDETPDESDGAAVAAVVAHYVVDLRADETRREDMLFQTQQKIAEVAKRHRNIEDSETINVWMDMYGLKEPTVFLPRMRVIIDALVGGEWWFDKDKLSQDLPVN